MRFPAACGSRLPGKNNPYSAAPSRQSMPRAIRAVVWSKCPPFSSQKRTGICFAQCAASKRVHASPCAMRGLPVRFSRSPMLRAKRTGAAGWLWAQSANRSYHREPEKQPTPSTGIPRSHAYTAKSPASEYPGQVAFRHRKRHPALQLFPQCHEFLQISRGAA